MLKENKKMVESNCLEIKRLQEKIKDYKKEIFEELQKRKAYNMIILRKKEKLKNSIFSFISVLDILALISLSIFNIPFFETMPFLSTTSLSFGLMVLPIGLKMFFISTDIKKGIDDLISIGVITLEEKKELLSKSKDYLISLRNKSDNNELFIESEIAKVEKLITRKTEENTKIRDLNQLQISNLSTKEVKEELENEFNEFLNDYTNPEDIHFNNKIEQPLKLTFTNK